MPAGKPATVYVWDEHLQRSGLRKRRLAVLSHEKEAVSQVGRQMSFSSAQRPDERYCCLFANADYLHYGQGIGPCLHAGGQST